ncbi:MAG: DUF4932 domain-containing protein [Acidobacteriota bacterium]
MCPSKREGRPGRSVTVTLVCAGLLGVLSVGRSPTLGAELPYVDDIQQERSSDGPARLVMRPSAKLDLVMIVAALADQQRAFMRSLHDEMLGAYWVNNTRQFALEAAPRHLKTLRAQGLWGDRLLELAMHLSEPPALERVVPWSDGLLAVAGGGEDETAPAQLDRFVDELRDFAEKSRFMERYTRKADEYQAMQTTLETTFKGTRPLEQNTGFWGVDAPGDFYLLPSPVMLGGSLASVAVGSRTHQFMAFGPARPEDLENTGFLHHVVYHELSHPLVDPVLAAHRDDLDGSKQLWFAVSSRLSRGQNVLNWTDCVGEHLLRAYNVRLLRDQSAVQAELAIDSEVAAGFLYMRQFLALLDDYAADRKRWPDLAAFMPEMSTRLDATASSDAAIDPATRPPAFSLNNPGFEATGDGWLVSGWELARAGSVPTVTDAGFPQVTRDGNNAHGGEASLRVDVTDATRDLIAVEQGPLAVRPGGTVRVSGWLKTDEVARHTGQQRVCGFYVLFMNGDGDVISRGETDSAVGTIDWTALSGEFVAPAGTVGARFGILLGMSGTAWFDDLNFERLD